MTHAAALCSATVVNCNALETPASCCLVMDISVFLTAVVFMFLCCVVRAIGWLMVWR